MHERVPSRYSSFLPSSKNMHVSLICDSKFPLGVRVGVHVFLSHCLCVGLLDEHLVQGVSGLLPNGTRDRLQPLYDPELDQVGIENGWIDPSRSVKIEQSSNVLTVGSEIVLLI